MPPLVGSGRHDVADEDEAFEIMNLIDPVLRTSNSGAVLAAVNCFLLLTKDMPDMRLQVYAELDTSVLLLLLLMPLVLQGVHMNAFPSDRSASSF